MIDIYFVQTLLNIIWYIFSILFVLYRFTTFFSYILNFVRFVGKIGSGIVYIKNQMSARLGFNNNQYIKIPSNSHTQNKTMFQKIKSKISSTYNYCFGKNSQQPDIEMCTTSIYDPPKVQERVAFEDYFDNLMKDSEVLHETPIVESNNISSESDEDQSPDMFFSTSDNNVPIASNFKEFLPFGENNENALLDSQMIYKYIHNNS